MGINAHRALFSSSSAQPTYLRELTVEEDDREELRGIRDEIRSRLKQGFADWTAHLDRAEMFEAASLLSFADAEPPPLRPKFRMQGSWSYDTLNRTTIEPPQEIDLDDGVFLPVSFLTQNGSSHPVVVSSAYFSAVEAILAPLCAEKGWILNTDKGSCVRVQVRKGAHIDLALYAIPDGEFETLLEKSMARAVSAFGVQVRDESATFDQEIYPHLPVDHIMLAHREEGWKPSDPRKLETWFRDAITQHGQQLRRVCRYLKGWRDHNWRACRLSSIVLMAAAVEGFNASPGLSEVRDDKALLFVAERLPDFLSNQIDNPVVPGQQLDEGWGDLRLEFVAKARELANELAATIADANRHTALTRLRGVLGEYVPDDFSLLEIEAVTSVITHGILGDHGDDAQPRDRVEIGGERRYG